jgi:hypothetical protein
VEIKETRDTTNQKHKTPITELIRSGLDA